MPRNTNAPGAGGRLGAGSSSDLTTTPRVAHGSAEPDPEGRRGRPWLRRLALNGLVRLAWGLDLAARLR